MKNAKTAKWIGALLTVGIFALWYIMPYSVSGDIYYMLGVFLGLGLWLYGDYSSGLLKIGRKLDGMGAVLASAITIFVLGYIYHYGPLLSASSGTGWINGLILIMVLLAAGNWVLAEKRHLK